MAAVEISVLLEISKELDQLRKDLEEVIQEINKIHKKLQSTPEVVEKSGDTILNKLRSLYSRAKDLSETELETLFLSGQSAAQKKKTEVSEQKKKLMKSESDLARFPPVASMRSLLEHATNLKGEEVGARVDSEDADKDNWIVVKVLHFDKDSKEKYKLSMQRIIPFPKKNDPSSAPDFPPEQLHCIKQLLLILASYILEFDDDFSIFEDGKLPQRNVPFYRVVPLPEGHRQ